jgi:hypothetical protein
MAQGKTLANFRIHVSCMAFAVRPELCDISELRLVGALVPGGAQPLALVRLSLSRAVLANDAKNHQYLAARMVPPALFCKLLQSDGDLDIVMLCRRVWFAMEVHSARSG